MSTRSCRRRFRTPTRSTSRSASPTTAPTGLRADGPLTATIDLGPDGKGRTLFRLKAGQLQGEAKLIAEATGGPAVDKDTIARTVRVVPDGFPGGGSVSDTIETRARGTIALPKDVVPGSLKVRLEVYPTTMADLEKGLEGMLHEPYGCFEQTSSTN